MEKKQYLSLANTIDLTISNIINGKAIPALIQNNQEGVIEKYSPRNGELLYRFSESTTEDINNAVAAARKTLTVESWSGLPISRRVAIINRLADLVERESETLALYECLDVGKTISAAQGDVRGAAGRLRSTAVLAKEITSVAAVDLGHMTYQHPKPVGVVACIPAWNYPLLTVAGKIAPALLMGNSVVLKPSEFCSLTSSRLAQLALEAGVPPGVFNVVHGSGSVVGEALTRHSDVDLVTFVGSTATGKKVMSAAGASNMKRVILECGGKNPFIIFDDCPEDLETLAAKIVNTAFRNQGENCMAASRLLLQKSISEKLLPLIVKKTSEIQVDDPLNPYATFGALINKAHMEKVLSHIDSGISEGAELLIGGERLSPRGEKSLSKGFYISPTIFNNVHPDSSIAQEEIFGPVLSVLTFEDENEAIALANSTVYGLTGYAATTNLARAQRLAARLNVGSCYIWGATATSGNAPDLGFTKQCQSGFGYKGGRSGLLEFCVTTTAHIYS